MRSLKHRNLDWCIFFVRGVTNNHVFSVRSRIILKNGHVQNILSFIENRKSGENFRTHLKRKKLSNIKKVTYQLNDDILFEVPPYMLDRSKLSAQKPLMVIFTLQF